MCYIELAEKMGFRTIVTQKPDIIDKLYKKKRSLKLIKNKCRRARVKAV